MHTYTCGQAIFGPGLDSHGHGKLVILKARDWKHVFDCRTRHLLKELFPLCGDSVTDVKGLQLTGQRLPAF